MQDRTHVWEVIGGHHFSKDLRSQARIVAQTTGKGLYIWDEDNKNAKILDSHVDDLITYLVCYRQLRIEEGTWDYDNDTRITFDNAAIAGTAGSGDNPARVNPTSEAPWVREDNCDCGRTEARQLHTSWCASNSSSP